MDTARKWELGVLAVLAVGLFLTPLVISSNTPYALDCKYLVAGTCAALCGVALAGWYLSGGRLGRNSRRLLLPLVLFMAAGAVSASFSEYPAQGLREMWWHFAHVMLFLALIVALRRREHRMPLFCAVIAAAGICALSGLLQRLGLDLYGIAWQKSDRIIRMAAGDRVLGTVGLETELGGYMAALAVFTAGLIFHFRSNILRLSLCVLGAWMIVCMFLSGTRSAWAACGVGFMILFFIAARKSLPWRWSAAAVCVLALAFSPIVYPRLRDLPKHLPVRTTIWSSALAMAGEKPIWGQGPGTFHAYFAAFRPLDFAEHGVRAVSLHAHSEYLELLSDGGIMGLGLFIWFAVLVFQNARRRFNSDDGMLVAAAFAGVVAILIHASVNVDTRYPTGRLTLWLLLGLTAAFSQDDAEPSASAGRWRAAGAIAAATIFFAALWFTQVYNPYAARVHLKAAQKFRSNGYFSRAAMKAELAIKHDPISVPAYYTLGNALAGEHKYIESLRVFAMLKKHSPHYADVDVRVGVLQALTDEMDDARASLALAERYGVLPELFVGFSGMADEELLSAVSRFVF